MADATEQIIDQKPAQDGGRDAAYWEAEAKKAFEARQKAKADADALKKQYEGIDPDEYRQLKDAQAKQEEDRAKKAGEFETLKQQLAKKHEQELSERDSKLSHLSTRFKDTVIKAEFGAASEYFSGAESSKTILDVELGMAALGKYVVVEDVEDDPLGYRVVVKTPRGDTILGKDGNPAPFAAAIGELIGLLPNKDRILRGSGKTGSGNSGGTGTQPASPDVTGRLTREQLADPKVRAALRQRNAAAGGMVIGAAFDEAFQKMADR